MAPNLQSEAFTNIVLCPWEIKRQNGTAYIQGGIATPSKLPEFARHHRGDRIADLDSDIPSATEKLNGNYVWGGCYHPHFGHFIAEFIHRLWVTRAPEHKDKTVLFSAQQNTSKVQPFFEETLSHFGIKNWRLIEAPLVIEELIIGEQGTHLNSLSKPAYFPYLQEAASDLVDYTYPKKICLLRGHLPNARLLGENALEQYLVSEGYVAFMPEEHSLKEQLKTLYNAEKIIASEGSALHLFDMLPPLSAEVAVINRRPNETFANSTLEGKTASFHVFNDVSVVYVPEFPHGRDPNKALSYADLSKVVQFLQVNGFTSGSGEISTNTEADFQEFVSANFTGSSHSTTELLVEELARRFDINRSINIENTYLKAKLAIAEQDFEAATQHIKHYLWMKPSGDKAEELVQDLKKLERNKLQ